MAWRDLSLGTNFLLHLAFRSGYTCSFPPVKVLRGLGLCWAGFQRAYPGIAARNPTFAREVKFGPNCKLCNLKAICYR
jgi:hypothetical protein